MIRSALSDSCCRCRQLLLITNAPPTSRVSLKQHQQHHHPSISQHTMYTLTRRISMPGGLPRQRRTHEDFFQYFVKGSIHHVALEQHSMSYKLRDVSARNNWSLLPRVLYCRYSFHNAPGQLPVGLNRRNASLRWSSSSNNKSGVKDEGTTGQASTSTYETAKVDSSLSARSVQQETKTAATTSETTSSNSGTSVSSTNSSLHDADHPHSGGKAVSDAVVAATHELEQRIKRVVRGENLTIGDQLSVALIAIFTAIVLSAPYAVRHMKQSANTVHGYEDRLQTDDPVDEFVKLARREWNMMDGNVDDEESNNGSEEKNQKFIEVVLQDVLQSKTVQHAAQEFVIQIIQSERFQSTIQHFVKELWNDLITDPETVAQVIKLLEIAITSTPIKNAVIELILQIAVRETEFRDAMIQTIQNLGMDADVQNAVVTLLTEATHTTLNDPDIFDHSMEFATDVVGDDIVQQTAGEALRKSVEHAVKPATTIILSACGVGLLIFSFIALGYSRSSETEARVFASAARSLQSNAAVGMSRILHWPFRTIPNVIKRAFNSLYDYFSTPAHQVSSRVYNGMCSFAVNVVSLAWNGLQRSAFWLSSKGSKMVHNIGASAYKHAATTANVIGVWMITSAIALVSSMENGVRSIAIMTGSYTLQAAKYAVRGCLTFTIQTSTYIGKAVTNFISAMFSSMKAYDEW